MIINKIIYFYVVLPPYSDTQFRSSIKKEGIEKTNEIFQLNFKQHKLFLSIVKVCESCMAFLIAFLQYRQQYVHQTLVMYMNEKLDNE